MAVSIRQMIADVHDLRETVEDTVVWRLQTDLARKFDTAERALYRARSQWLGLMNIGDDRRLVHSVKNNQAAVKAMAVVKRQVDRYLGGPGAQWAEKMTAAMDKAGRDLARANLDVEFLDQNRVNAIVDHTSRATADVLRVGRADSLYAIKNMVGGDLQTWFRATLMDSLADGLPVQGPGDTLERRLFEGGRIRPLEIRTRTGRVIRRSVATRATAIARVESAKIMNRVHENLALEAIGDGAVFFNSNPMDSSTTHICLEASAERPKTMGGWSDSRFGRPPRLRPFHLCRSVLIGGEPEWFEDVPAPGSRSNLLEPVTAKRGRPKKPPKPKAKPKEKKPSARVLAAARLAIARDHKANIRERIENYDAGDMKVKQIQAVKQDADARLREMDRELAASDESIRKAELALDDHSLERPRMDEPEYIAWHREHTPLLVNLQNLLDSTRTQRGERLAIASQMREDVDKVLSTGRRTMVKPMRPGRMYKEIDQGPDVDPLLERVKGGSSHPSYDEAMEKAKTAAAWVNKVAKRGATTVEIDMEIILGRSRAWHQATYPRPTIHVGTASTIGTHVHELGHTLESYYAYGKTAAQDFLTYRRAGEQPRRFMDVFPGSNYKETEIGIKDRFDETFPGDLNSAYYTGKLYAHNSTEVVSMGVQALYEDPTGFVSRDPEFAKFIMGYLDGTFTM